MAGKKLVVREHAPWRQWLWVGLSAVVFGIGAYALYAYTVSRLPYEWEQLEIQRAKLESERKKLVREIRQLKTENRRQAEEIVALERGLEIDNESVTELQRSLRDMQEQLAAQEEQLAFYRGIVSPEQSRAGLRIYDFEVRDGGEAGLYLFELILIQAVRHDKTVSGEVGIEIIGMQGGVEKRLPLNSIMLAKDKRVAFSFRYFQDLNGIFRLPDGFRPSGVKIRVNTNGPGAAGFEQDYQWTEVRDRTGA